MYKVIFTRCTRVIVICISITSNKVSDKTNNVICKSRCIFPLLNFSQKTQQAASEIARVQADILFTVHTHV